MIATMSTLRNLICLFVIALGCTESFAQYSIGTRCFEATEDGYSERGVGISSPIGVACETTHHGTIDRPIVTVVRRDNLFVHLGNTTVSLRADLVSLKTELDALRIDYLRVKTENEQWRINTLSAALDRIEKMPGEFASLKSVQDVLTPLIIEAIKNDPTLLAKLKAP